jgi:small subunit ribosomal protein S2
VASLLGSGTGFGFFSTFSFLNDTAFRLFNRLNFEFYFEMRMVFGHTVWDWRDSNRSFALTAVNRRVMFDLQTTTLGFRRAFFFLAQALTSYRRMCLLFVSGIPQYNDFSRFLDFHRDRLSVLGHGYMIHWVSGFLTNMATLVRTFWSKGSTVTGHYKKYTKRRWFIESVKGVRLLQRFPDTVCFLSVSGIYKIALREAIALKIPLIAFVDSDCETQGIPYPIMGNDDSFLGTDTKIFLLREFLLRVLKNALFRELTDLEIESKSLHQDTLSLYVQEYLGEVINSSSLKLGVGEDRLLSNTVSVKKYDKKFLSVSSSFERMSFREGGGVAELPAGLLQGVIAYSLRNRGLILLPFCFGAVSSFLVKWRRVSVFVSYSDSLVVWIKKRGRVLSFPFCLLVNSVARKSLSWGILFAYPSWWAIRQHLDYLVAFRFLVVCGDTRSNMFHGFLGSTLYTRCCFSSRRSIFLRVRLDRTRGFVDCSRILYAPGVVGEKGGYLKPFLTTPLVSGRSLGGFPRFGGLMQNYLNREFRPLLRVKDKNRRRNLLKCVLLEKVQSLRRRLVRTNARRLQKKWRRNFFLVRGTRQLLVWSVLVSFLFKKFKNHRGWRHPVNVKKFCFSFFRKRMAAKPRWFRSARFFFIRYTKYFRLRKALTGLFPKLLLPVSHLRQPRNHAWFMRKLRGGVRGGVGAYRRLRRWFVVYLSRLLRQQFWQRAAVMGGYLGFKLYGLLGRGVGVLLSDYLRISQLKRVRLRVLWCVVEVAVREAALVVRFLYRQYTPAEVVALILFRFCRIGQRWCGGLLTNSVDTVLGSLFTAEGCIRRYGLGGFRTLVHRLRLVYLTRKRYRFVNSMSGVLRRGALFSSLLTQFRYGLRDGCILKKGYHLHNNFPSSGFVLGGGGVARLGWLDFLVRMTAAGWCGLGARYLYLTRRARKGRGLYLHPTVKACNFLSKSSFFFVLYINRKWKRIRCSNVTRFACFPTKSFYANGSYQRLQYTKIFNVSTSY